MERAGSVVMKALVLPMNPSELWKMAEEIREFSEGLPDACLLCLRETF